MYSQRTDFTEPFVNGMRGQLLDRRHGLLMTSPMTLMSLVGVVCLARTKPRLTLHIATASRALFLFYATYREWPASHYGNRFLMPAVALCVAPLAALIQAVTDARRPTIGPAGRAQT